MKFKDVFMIEMIEVDERACLCGKLYCSERNPVFFILLVSESSSSCLLFGDCYPTILTMLLSILNRYAK